MIRSGPLVAMFVAAATAAGDPVPVGDPARGEKTYADSCTSCHASVARTVRLIKGKTAAEKQVWLEKFLPDHHAADAAARVDLIAFLLSRQT